MSEYIKHLKLDVTPIDTIVNARTRNQLGTIRKGGHSEKEVTEFGRELVRRWNSQPDLLALCEEFMEMADDGSAAFDDPVPGSIYLRAKVSIAKAQSKQSVAP